MIIQEQITINGASYLHVFSDIGKMLKSSSGNKYSDVVDNQNSLITYSETEEDAPITLTQSMIDSPEWSKENNNIYEIRVDEHGNLNAQIIYDA